MTLLQILPVCKQEAKEHLKNQNERQQEQIEQNQKFLDSEHLGGMVTVDHNANPSKVNRAKFPLILLINSNFFTQG